MRKYYIGNRLSFDEMSTILGTNAMRLNNRLSETLRSIALRKGIAKTKNKKKLVFYSVDEKQFELLIKPHTAIMIALKNNLQWLPLIAVDVEKMSSSLEEVNQKYVGRMNRETYKIYNTELEKALDECVVPLNNDRKKKQAAQ
jgi:hypothetical protein